MKTKNNLCKDDKTQLDLNKINTRPDLSFHREICVCKNTRLLTMNTNLLYHTKINNLFYI